MYVTINAQPQILCSSRLVYVGMWSPKSVAADPIEAISENPRENEVHGLLNLLSSVAGRYNSRTLQVSTESLTDSPGERV